MGPNELESLESFRAGRESVEYWRDDDLHCLSWRSRRHPMGITCRGLTAADMLARAWRAETETGVLADLARHKLLEDCPDTLPSPAPEMA